MALFSGLFSICTIRRIRIRRRCYQSMCTAHYVISKTLLMTCLDENNLAGLRSFNHSVIGTRRVLENAIVCLKGKWRILTHNWVSEPAMARQTALVPASLHNVCERCQSPFEDSWIPAEVQTVANPPNNGNVLHEHSNIRQAWAQSVHQRLHL